MVTKRLWTITDGNYLYTYSSNLQKSVKLSSSSLPRRKSVEFMWKMFLKNLEKNVFVFEYYLFPFVFLALETIEKLSEFNIFFKPEKRQYLPHRRSD